MRALLLIAIAVAASAQQISLVDAVVTGADGKPVTGLKPADFEITEAGKPRPVTRLSEFDTVQHTGVNSGDLPALALTPDQNHRTLVFIVDDLCGSPTALDEVRRQLREAAANRFTSADRIAILRTSGGNSRTQQLTGDPREIARAIDLVEYLGAHVTHDACAYAAWSSISYALSGLKTVEGRKAVILMSADLPAPSAATLGDMGRMAARALATVSQVGTSAELDRVIAEQQSYYVLGFESGGGSGLAVKLRRTDLTVRARNEPITISTHSGFAALRPENEMLVEAINSPFEGTGIGVHLTTLFSNNQQDGSVIEALVYIDAHDLSWLRDEKGKFHANFELLLGSVLGTGQITAPAGQSHTLQATPEEYQNILRDGLVYTVRVNAWSAGPRQVRALAADGRSGRMGSANAFEEILDFTKGGFFLSGIVIQGAATAKESAASRVFHPGEVVSFIYNVFNAFMGPDDRPEIETQTALFAGGRQIFTGRPQPIKFEVSRDPRRLQINGKLSLDRAIGLGHYVLVVTVTDKGPQPRVARHAIDFTIE